MKKVLIFGMNENPGGVESFIRNYYKAIDKDKIQFEFLCNSNAQVAYEEELSQEGAKFYHLTPRSKNPLKFYKELNAFFKAQAKAYDAIWVNVCSLANVGYLKLAKKYGIKRIIIHSHNSQNMDTKLRGYLHDWNKKNIQNLATDFWACSKSAGQWFYPDQLQDRVKVVPNAIALDKIAFDESRRQAIRQELGWSDKLVLGNVGRLHFQKNQSFLLDLFAQAYAKNQDLRLVLVGQGPDQAALEEKVNQLGLEDSVKLVGVQTDMGGWLSAFDVFVFPSLFEGLPIAALEAQANGVPVLASAEGLDEFARLNRNVFVQSLKDGMDDWLSALDQALASSRITSKELVQSFEAAGFEIHSAARQLEKELEK